MLYLIWVLRITMSMLRICENCMGKLGWPKCMGMLGWFKCMRMLGWLESAFPAAWTCLFKVRPGKYNSS